MWQKLSVEMQKYGINYKLHQFFPRNRLKTVEKR